MAADLIPGKEEGGSFPHQFVLVNDRAVFLAYGSSSWDADLWATDGTPEGTEILIPGPLVDGSIQFAGRSPDVLFWVASTGPGGYNTQLWRTDGTSEGTWPLTPSGYAVESCVPESAEPCPVLHGRIFFLMHRDDPADPGPSSRSLWVSDGTPGGTHPIEPFLPGLEIDRPRVLGAAGDQVFFDAWYRTGTVDHYGLFRTDGTSPGTRLIREFSGSCVGCYASAWVPFANRLLFFANSSASSIDIELWASDGSAAGTVPLSRFSKAYPTQGDAWIQVLGRRAYFVASDAATGLDFELWATDGTRRGTGPITNLHDPTPFVGRGGLARTQLASLGGRIYFIARDENSDRYLWSTDGNPGSTTQILPIDDLETFAGRPDVQIAEVAGRLFFDVQRQGRNELWATDGSAASAARVPLPSCSRTVFWYPGLPGAEAAIFAVGCSPQVGEELFQVDAESLKGDPATTRLFGELRPVGRSIQPIELTALGDDLYFRLPDGPQPDDLWHTGGDETSTTTVAGPSTGGCPLNQVTPFDPHRSLAAAGGYLLFFCRDPALPQLWRTDGTPAGTNPLVAEPLLTGPRFDGMISAGDRLYLTLPFGSSTLLWVSDGTPEGTVPLVSQESHGVHSVSSPVAVENRLFFLAQHPERGTDVWTSDGSPAGTQRLTELGEGVVSYPLSGPEFARLGGLVYFGLLLRPRTPLQDLEVWRTDGTPAGTERAFRLADLGLANDLLGLRSLGDRLVFFAREASGRQYYLYRTDGTEAGTERVSDVCWLWYPPGERPTAAVLGSEILFAAVADDSGVELWKSDGTAGGTVMVKDIAPGPGRSTPRSLNVAGGQVFFSAWTAALGEELWMTDGTAEGTHLVHDIAPGPYHSSPRQFTVAGSRLYFSADDRLHGRELWSLPLDETGCVPSPRALCLNGERFRVEADWQDFRNHVGRATAVPLTADTGYFWFFRDTNVEVIAKVLDGRLLNDHFWFFYGALSNVEYHLTVTDAETGVSRRYFNRSGRFGSRGDTAAFGPHGASLESYIPPVEEPGVAPPMLRREGLSPTEGGRSCAASPTRLCLQGGRFAVEASWRDFRGNSGVGRAVGLTPDTGYFWFFRRTNVEVVLKVLDGLPVNGKFWVFYGALSNVEYTLTVTDTLTGQARTYFNPLGRFASVGDAAAF